MGPPLATSSVNTSQVVNIKKKKKKEIRNDTYMHLELGYCYIGYIALFCINTLFTGT